MGSDTIYQCAWGSEKLRIFPFIPERDRAILTFRCGGDLPLWRVLVDDSGECVGERTVVYCG